MRKRDRIIVSSKIDIPLQTEGQDLSYDSIRHFDDKEWTRAHVKIISATNPMNGVSGKNNLKISHCFTVFKKNQYTVDQQILWLDGVMPRLLKIISVEQHKKNRRLINLYAKEIAYGEQTDITKTTYGQTLTPENTNNSLQTILYT